MNEQQNKHTPTPWVTIGHDQSITISDAEGNSIAVISRTSANHYDNARLIAAAPELLEALKNFVNGAEGGDITSDQDETFSYATIQANAAINKARGIDP